ncbi:MAG TPA: diacylglycerol kinase family protein [Patescibacteria group bacterium]|nr:diacylglycerol kinase family protein [Patescibacteria group bacterium]
MKKILYLINPSANENQAMSSWQKARRQMPHIPREPVNILNIPDLKSFLLDKNPDIIVIAGGDGTINKICESIIAFKKKPILAIFPLGFGNALAHCLGVETTKKAAEVIKYAEKSIAIDVFSTTVPAFPLCIFTMGVGIDGYIVYKRNYRYIGFRSYILSAITGMMQHQKKQLTFTIDHNVTVKATASSLVITNAPIVGKNVVISENAKLNDGFLSCILFSTKYSYITNLRLKGFKHPFYSEDNKMYFKAKHIKIEGDSYVQIDGDSALINSPIEIAILPKAVHFLCNDNKHIDLLTTPFV